MHRKITYGEHYMSYYYVKRQNTYSLKQELLNYSFFYTLALKSILDFELKYSQREKKNQDWLLGMIWNS